MNAHELAKMLLAGADLPVVMFRHPRSQIVDEVAKTPTAVLVGQDRDGGDLELASGPPSGFPERTQNMILLEG